MNAIILGSRSEIAKDLTSLLLRDGWHTEGWSRGQTMRTCRWDLVIVAIGIVAPVGHWWDTAGFEWEQCLKANVSVPIELLKQIWGNRNPGAMVCFMAGSNPQKPMAGYSAYNAGKMALLKVIEQLDFETPDHAFFALGPGYVKTKIHKATLDANWPNERIARGDSGTSIEKIYDCLKWCLSQPKEVVGGRNICVSDPYGPELAERLKANGSLYKLRRVE